MPDFHIGLYNNSTNKLYDSKTFTAVDAATALTNAASDTEFLTFGTIPGTNTPRIIENSTSSSVVVALLALVATVYSAINSALSSFNVFGGQLDDVGTTAATENNVAPVRITAQRALHTNLRNNSGTEIGTTATPLVIQNAGTTKTITTASIDISSSGHNSVIAAPGSGVFIKIIALYIQNTSDTDLTVILEDGTTSFSGDGFILAGNASTTPFKSDFQFNAPGGVGHGEIKLSDNAKFQINLSASKQVSGFVIYRIDS